MNPRQLKLLGAAILAALVIASLLQDVVEQLIVRPIAYLLWSLGVFYRIIPQPVLWLVLVLAMLYLSLGNFSAKFRWPRLRGSKPRPVRGPLDELATQIERKNDGIYLKWKIARTLSEIALDLQELRQHARHRKLDFDGSAATPDVRRYLDAGLNTSFSDYPLPAGLPLPVPLKSLPPTPFDSDIVPVLEYLETQMENDNDRRRA